MPLHNCNKLTSNLPDSPFNSPPHRTYIYSSNKSLSILCKSYNHSWLLWAHIASHMAICTLVIGWTIPLVAFKLEKSSDSLALHTKWYFNVHRIQLIEPWLRPLDAVIILWTCYVRIYVCMYIRFVGLEKTRKQGIIAVKKKTKIPICRWRTSSIYHNNNLSDFCQIISFRIIWLQEMSEIYKKHIRHVCSYYWKHF